MTTEPVLVDLGKFDGSDLDRGRSRSVELVWYLTKLAFFQSGFPWPSRFKRWLLICFGASVGRGLYMRPRVNIHFPWKLRLGDNVWIGEGCTLLNLAEISMADNSALAHEVYLAAAGHDIESPSFAYDNREIHIGRGAWIATRAYVGPGVHIGDGSVVAAGGVVVRDVPAQQVVAGVPARIIARRAVRGD